MLPPSLYFIDGYTFASCDSLKKIYMTDGVEKIGDSAFTGCKSLESIFIPKTVRAIGNGVFTGCNNLSDIQISKIIEYSVKRIIALLTMIQKH